MTKPHSHTYIGDTFKSIFIALHPDVPMQADDINALKKAIKKLNALSEEWQKSDLSDITQWIGEAVSMIEHEDYRRMWAGCLPVQMLKKVQIKLQIFIDRYGKMTVEQNFELHAVCALAQALWIRWRFLKIKH
ncbi:hypothetical protein HYT05_01655 [Candidatus Kaiserbacteria bacterium]|nr:hypothetical protein [Candidatus Kaiserbacteria bacterium]